ncbi:DUF6350 family protein [uncultured Friedmanniella sp.]|uniref:cell division protein PerM n=1 Tax=uncultured Friedmanniella sp. TaxID=335381 RepID=UPI0035CB02D7
MASLLSPRRTDVDLALHASVPADPDRGRTSPEPQRLRIGWPLAALVGVLLSVAATWLLVAGLAVVGWVAGDPGSLNGALRVGTRLWLAGSGVGVQLGRVDVTLVPWGLTALTAVLLSRAAAFAARSARPDTEPRPLPLALFVVGCYLLPVLVVAAAEGRPSLAPGHLAVVVAVLALAALHGAARALGVSLTRRWPAWLRPVPRAVVGAQVVLVASGAAVLITAVVRHLDRVTALQEQLHPGVTGAIALLGAQLALAPNAFVWATSYALGGGFTLGNGSIVAPGGTDLGVLPGLPLLGALPGEGPGPVVALWWLAAGVLAGTVAAWLVVRARPQARFDETSLVGGLAGLTGGLVFVGLAWAASGDLGILRLSGLGPLLLPLLVMAVTTLGLSGMVTGLALGLGRRRSRRTATVPETATVLETATVPETEATEVLHRRAGATALKPDAAEPGAAVPSTDEPTEILRPPATPGRPEQSR